jgi:hypothetical protein
MTFDEWYTTKYEGHDSGLLMTYSAAKQAWQAALESRVLAERKPSPKDQARRFVSDFTREMGFAMSDHAQEVMLNLFLRHVAHPTPDDTKDAERWRWLCSLGKNKEACDAEADAAIDRARQSGEEGK